MCSDSAQSMCIPSRIESVVRPFRFWTWHYFILRLHVLALIFIGILLKQPNWKFLSGPTVDSKVQVTEKVRNKWQYLSGPTSMDSSSCACFVDHIWAAVAYLSILCGTAEGVCNNCTSDCGFSVCSCGNAMTGWKHGELSHCKCMVPL